MSYGTIIGELRDELGSDVDVEVLEAWIRLERPTLDALDRLQFRREVAIAIACAGESSPDENEAVRQTFFPARR
ncbi:MAG TPA: hypothetical protein VD838_21210 [Anaeromyxobacteraceae bacterium]|nr:hypothetical protein [Anaeromyxobacteraceae bacterium]